MKKLTLEIGELAVQSFATGQDGGVRGHDVGPTIPSCPSFNLCPTDDCPSGACPTNATTLCPC